MLIKGGKAVQNIIMILLKGVHQRQKLDWDDIEKWQLSSKSHIHNVYGWSILRGNIEKLQKDISQTRIQCQMSKIDYDLPFYKMNELKNFFTFLEGVQYSSELTAHQVRASFLDLS